MLNKDLEGIISKIHYAQQHKQQMLKNAGEKHKREDEYRKEAEAFEKAALDAELEVDKLQLEMRKVLNGLPSDLVVSGPVFATEEDEIGRRG